VVAEVRYCSWRPGATGLLELVRRAGAWFLGRVLGFALFALLIGILNLAILGGQWLWHLPHRAELAGEEANLASSRQELEPTLVGVQRLSAAIADLEARIKALDESADQMEYSLEERKREIQEYESLVESGVPSSVYEEYTASIEEHNRLVDDINQSCGERRALYSRYSALLGEYRAAAEQLDVAASAYNARVDRWNELARKAGTYWYLVPVPLPSRSAGHHPVPRFAPVGAH
jgi:hypothetical protein